MLELGMCPVCDGTNLSVLAKCFCKKSDFNGLSASVINQILDYVIRTEAIEISTVQCGFCRHIFLNPSFTKDELGRLYSSELLQRLSPLYGEIAPSGSKEMAANAIKWRRRFLRKTAKKFARGPIKRVLDIGGATGYNITEFEGEKCVYDLHVRPESNSIRYFTSMQEAAASGKFDVIVSTHTFEHIVHPRQAMEEYSSLMEKGGIFLVEVPMQYLGPVIRKIGIPIGEHINFFSQTSLGKLFELTGFKQLFMETRNVPYGDIHLNAIIGVFSYEGVRNQRKPSSLGWYSNLILNFSSALMFRALKRVPPS